METVKNIHAEAFKKNLTALKKNAEGLDNELVQLGNRYNEMCLRIARANGRRLLAAANDCVRAADSCVTLVRGIARTATHSLGVAAAAIDVSQADDEALSTLGAQAAE